MSESISLTITIDPDRLDQLGIPDLDAETIASIVCAALQDFADSQQAVARQLFDNFDDDTPSNPGESLPYTSSFDRVLIARAAAAAISAC